MIYLYLTGVRPTSVHLMGGCLIGVHPMGVHLTGGCLIGAHLMGVHLTGVYLMGVHLMGVYLTGVHLIYESSLRAGPGWRESLYRHKDVLKLLDCGRLDRQAAGHP